LNISKGGTGWHGSWWLGRVFNGSLDTWHVGIFGVIIDTFFTFSILYYWDKNILINYTWNLTFWLSVFKVEEVRINMYRKFKIDKLLLPLGKQNPLYTKYVGWSFVSNIFVSTQTAIVTDNMLYAINYESESIRSINYIGKDIIGQIGSLIFLSKIGNQPDKNSKSFLLYSNVIQQSSLLCVSLTPLVPVYFLPIAGVSNILSNLSFTGFGAINAKCIEKLSIDNNIGELYSKITIINTIGSSIGLLLGLGINIMIPDHQERALLIPLLGLMKVYAYNKAIENLL
jgi:hypothetical protein